MRPESDAPTAHDDNHIRSKQPEDASDKIGGKDEAAEMAGPLQMLGSRCYARRLCSRECYGCV